MTNGVCIVCFDRDHDGERYGKQAFGSIGSVRRFDKTIPITVFTNFDRWTAEWQARYDADVHYLDMPDSDNRLVKTDLYRLSPFERTMYLDCDAVVRREEAFSGFRWLDRWQLICTTHHHEQMVTDRPRPEHVGGITAMTGTREVAYFCSGLIFFGRSQTVERLFSLWRSLYQSGVSLDEHGKAQDMYPFNLAIWQTKGLSVFDMGWRYSCKDVDIPDAIVVHEGGRNGKPLPEAIAYFNQEQGH